MTYEYQYLTLRDGRTLEFADNGVSSPLALIFHQGTGQDLSGWYPWFDLLSERGIRAVAFNRSGYAKSSFKPGRRTVDAVTEVKELSDELGLTGFVSLGWSGGGSHALATALDPRCKGVLTLAGIGPYGEPDLDFLDGFKDADLEEYEAAFRSIDDLIAIISDDERDVYWTPKDVEAMTRPEWETMGVEPSKRVSSFGWDFLRDDYSAYLNPWGFDVREITVPVAIFQGDLDGNVPVGHARWLQSKIQSSELIEKPGEGHISLVFTYAEEILQKAADYLLR